VMEFVGRDGDCMRIDVGLGRAGRGRAEPGVLEPAAVIELTPQMRILAAVEAITAPCNRSDRSASRRKELSWGTRGRRHSVSLRRYTGAMFGYTSLFWGVLAACHAARGPPIDPARTGFLRENRDTNPHRRKSE
jgi:hypothetical protein